MAFAWTFNVLILAKFSNSFKLFSFLVSFSYRVHRQCLNIQMLILLINLTHFVPTLIPMNGYCKTWRYQQSCHSFSIIKFFPFSPIMGVEMTLCLLWMPSLLLPWLVPPLIPPIKAIVKVLMVNVSYTKIELDKDFFVEAYWSNMLEWLRCELNASSNG